MASVLLPVPLSPMISCRWPLPMGMSVSTILLPVYIGCATKSRAIIGGERTSSKRRTPRASGPPSSSGSPSGSITLPSKASPTPMLRRLPVKKADVPAVSRSVWRNKIVPIRLHARWNISALLPSSSCTISSMRAEGSPLIQAMPSPTDTTVPCSDKRRPKRYCASHSACAASGESAAIKPLSSMT